jgi:hypothetical protein
VFLYLFEYSRTHREALRDMQHCGR